MSAPSPFRSVAVVGAGLSGLACAATLAEAGVAVTVFDKARRPGGRIATRRTQGLSFNHGAQFATARGELFSRLVRDLADRSEMAFWPQAAGWVGLPGMSALPAAMVERLDAGFRMERQVSWLEVGGVLRHLPAEAIRPGMTSRDGEAAGPFDAILLALPAPQAAPLVATLDAGLAESLDRVSLAPCWSVMVAFNAAVAGEDVMQPESGPLGWVARENSRPGQAGLPDRWMLHATPAWSREHLESPADTVAQALLAAFRALAPCGAPVVLAAHRWRHAKVETALGQTCLWDGGLRVGLCGDWCLGPRVECAFDSGVALAQAVLAAA